MYQLLPSYLRDLSIIIPATNQWPAVLFRACNRDNTPDTNSGLERELYRESTLRASLRRRPPTSCQPAVRQKQDQP